MQNRMKTHQLSEAEINTLLTQCKCGVLATVNPDETPYCVPVHFVFMNDAIYIHGLPAGQKIENISANPDVCFTAYEMKGLLYDPEEKLCDTNTEYISAVIQGSAVIENDEVSKKEVLYEIIRKYTPHLTQKEIPDNMLKGTAVIKIEITRQSGKYYK